MKLIRNDDLNETAKELVRDKSIQSKADLEKKVDEVFDTTIRGYILWQYYNQVTNDLIEHIFNDHENVIPTLRKIKYVDFLIKKGEYKYTLPYQNRKPNQKSDGIEYIGFMICFCL